MNFLKIKKKFFINTNSKKILVSKRIIHFSYIFLLQSNSSSIIIIVFAILKIHLVGIKQFVQSSRSQCSKCIEKIRSEVIRISSGGDS